MHKNKKGLSPLVLRVGKKKKKKKASDFANFQNPPTFPILTSIDKNPILHLC